MSDILLYKLNKYLIDIIDQYNIINFDVFINEIPKERINIEFKINNQLTIEDILIICYRQGYKGFCVAKKYNMLIEKIDCLKNNLIEKINNPDSFLYYFSCDMRNIFFQDIMHLENVIIKKYSIVNI